MFRMSTINFPTLPILENLLRHWKKKAYEIIGIPGKFIANVLDCNECFLSLLKISPHFWAIENVLGQWNNLYINIKGMGKT